MSQTQPSITPLSRVFSSVGHTESDRVPFFINAPFHAARAMGLTQEEMYAKASLVVEAQLRGLARFDHDFVSGYLHVALELQAWGIQPEFPSEGPPRVGAPNIGDLEQINSLVAPEISSSEPLSRQLETISILHAKVGGRLPVLGALVSPFSLPVVQLGMEAYLQLIFERRELFDRLMHINGEFCVAWANAQFAAGATVLAYVDPFSSPTLIPHDLFLQTGFEVAKRTISRFSGPSVYALASGRSLEIAADVAQTGALGIGVSCHDDLHAMKDICRGKLLIIGNLDGLKLRHRSPSEAEQDVRRVLRIAGPGGGLLLSDNHGEMPYDVADEVLDTIAEAVHRWGRYPISFGTRDEP